MRRTEGEQVMNQATDWTLSTNSKTRLAVQGTRFLMSAILVCLISAGMLSAQTQNQRYDTESMSAKSRAEQAAEQQVALSPEKIIELLRQEPGLLLQVKKMLMRKAYEQGRILDPEDLTDDALFQLLHEDHNICVLATREIEDRAYVRAKPRLEEIQQQRERDQRVGLSKAVTPETQKPEGAAPTLSSQEATYWAKHDGSTEEGRTGQPQFQPQQAQPASPSVPQNPPAVNNPQRQVEMTGLPQNFDLYDDMGVEPSSQVSESGAMSRIAPEQLPGLLNASSSSTLNSATLDGSTALRGRINSQVPSYGSSLSAANPPAGAMNSPQRSSADFG